MTQIIEQSNKPEFELRPIEEIVKRYKRVLKEYNKPYDNKDVDERKVNLIYNIRQAELRWVLGKD